MSSGHRAPRSVIGGSHSHHKRMQLAQRVQQGSFEGGESPFLSGIPSSSQSKLPHTLSQPDLNDEEEQKQHNGQNNSELGPYSSQRKLMGGFRGRDITIPSGHHSGGVDSRASTGYFSMGGVSARYNHPGVILKSPNDYATSPGGFSGRRSTAPTTVASLKNVSRSLGASKASLASYRSGKTSIQQEYHDHLVRQQLQHPCSGEGRVPFILTLVCLLLFASAMIAGIVVMLMRWQGTLFLTLDKEEMIGPGLIAGSFLFLGLAGRFGLQAYHLRQKEITNLRFRPSSNSMVSVKSAVKSPDVNERLVSGTASKTAITRTPIGSQAGSVRSLV